MTPTTYWSKMSGRFTNAVLVGRRGQSGSSQLNDLQSTGVSPLTYSIALNEKISPSERVHCTRTTVFGSSDRLMPQTNTSVFRYDFCCSQDPSSNCGEISGGNCTVKISLLICNTTTTCWILSVLVEIMHTQFRLHSNRICVFSLCIVSLVAIGVDILLWSCLSFLQELNYVVSSCCLTKFFWLETLTGVFWNYKCYENCHQY